MAASAVVLLVGCGTAEDPVDPPVARAYGEELRWSDLRQVVPIDANEADSAALAENFIGNWLRQQVVLHKAEENLGSSNTDFELQLRDYRNSLVIYAYEEALVQQKLDTAVGLQEMEDYYAKNRSDFELKESILRARWAKVKDDDRRTMKRLEDAFLSGNGDRMRDYEVWLAERGIPIVDRSASWITFSELRAEVPMGTKELTDVMDRGGKFVIKEGGVTCFVDILEHRLADSVSPLDLVKQDIRSIIINQRKRLLTERMRNDLYDEAVERKDIEVL